MTALVFVPVQLFLFVCAAKLCTLPFDHPGMHRDDHGYRWIE